MGFYCDEIEANVAPGKVDLPTSISKDPGNVHLSKVIAGSWGSVHCGDLKTPNSY